jgi:putative transposase
MELITQVGRFFDEHDYQFFRNCLHTAATEESVAVHAYVLMSNHLHLLLTAGADQGVSALM